jgi:cell division cycle 20-like protein 1, cofactor of APC complex
MSDHYFRRLGAHNQEVCGLRWNSEEGQLASGGNDNKLFIWDRANEKPLYSFSDHTAAIKAMSWSPHHRGILATGGGTADRKIRFWNSMTGQCVNIIDTGSQVCNLAWSKNSNELVSTHGYSQNHLAVWKYPSLTQVAVLTGHTSRVLYLAMSPDGQTIVTGAGDETLRFWTIFAKSKQISTSAEYDSMSLIR